MRGAFVRLGLAVALAAGCGDKDDGGGGGAEGGGGEDGGGESGGGGSGGGGDDGGEDWLATGSGTAKLSDGATINSVFDLEMVGVSLPGEGMGYHAWLSGGSEGDLYLGEIEVAAEGELSWSVDTETDLLLSGNTRLEVWRGTGEDAREAGEAVWSGSFPEDLLSALVSLLAASEDTVTGEGSVRALVSNIEFIRDHARAASESSEEATALKAEGEKVANAIAGEENDLDGDGTAGVLEGVSPILDSEGLIELVLDDLADLSRAVEHGDPVKDYANWAYDCVERVESYAEDAQTHAGLASVCGAESACAGELASAAEDLDRAVEGEDLDEDGSIDEIEEGTAACARAWVREAMAMEVGTGG